MGVFFCSDHSQLCKIVAWVEIILSGLYLASIGLFTILLVSVPEILNHVVEEDPEEHKEIEAFLELSGIVQAICIVLLVGLWSIILSLAILLLKWTKSRNVRGLQIWLYCSAAIIFLSMPLDFMLLYKDEFRITTIALFALGYAYAVFSLYVVWSFRKFILSREGESSQIVEFQTL